MDLHADHKRVSTRPSSLSGLFSGPSPGLPLSDTGVIERSQPYTFITSSFLSIMRFTASIFASIFLLASSISAQKSGSNDVDPSQLLAELAELPECAVSEWMILLRLRLLIVEQPS
jgi:hypothetical protein